MNWPVRPYWSLGYQRLSFVKSNTLFWAQRSNILRKSGKEYRGENLWARGGQLRRRWLKPLQQICALDRKQILIFILHTILLSPCSLRSLCYTCHIYRNNIPFIEGISVIFQVVLNQKRSLQLIKVSSWHHQHQGCWGIWQPSSRLDRSDHL